ncbi:MAG TPA: DUF3617 domain-containing protein [Burkholderiaceae bacterium]|nr:DUF3617 domain-containing protein [Burkholderiaceae bacterium]
MNANWIKGAVLAGGLLAAGLSAAPAQAQMKAGLWETRVTRQTLNGEDMNARMAEAQKRMQEATARMTPEQRKQMEQMMGKQGMQMGTPGTARFCVSAAMAARQEPLPDPEGHCKNEKFVRSGNTVDFEFVCTRPDGTMRGKGRTSFSGDSSRTEMTMTGQRAGKPMNMVMESESRYLGADCGGLKPIDQALRK